MSRKCSVNIESKPCHKSSFAVCEGCHQPLCLPHLNAHQQELAIQMEAIVSDHDQLHEELDKHRIHSEYQEYKMPDFADEFNRIDAWQTRTLKKVTGIITQEADRARNVIHTIMNENQRRAAFDRDASSQEFEQLKKRLAMLSEQLQERVKTGDYLEPNLRQWQDQLTDIRMSSMKPKVRTPVIVDKLIVEEMRKIQINVSNILDIQYDDVEKYKVPEKSHRMDIDEEFYDGDDDEVQHSSKTAYTKRSSALLWDYLNRKPRMNSTEISDESLCENRRGNKNS